MWIVNLAEYRWKSELVFLINWQSCKPSISSASIFWFWTRSVFVTFRSFQDLYRPQHFYRQTRGVFLRQSCLATPVADFRLGNDEAAQKIQQNLLDLWVVTARACNFELNQNSLMQISDQRQWNDQTFDDIVEELSNFTGFAFDDCTFEKCDFLGGCWNNATFTNCQFKLCNLSNLSVSNCKFDAVSFEECKLVGLHFSTCKKLLFSISLNRAQLLLCNFSEMNLLHMSFGASELKECDFFHAKLVGADFSNCNLAGSMFENSNLKSADFRQASNYEIDPSRNQIAKARFSMPEVLSLLAPLGIEISAD